MAGAVVKFAATAENRSFGFYVHIGTNQTYGPDAHEYLDPSTDSDYYRGFVGAAAAIWSNAWHSAAEHAISKAEEVIAKAESEGRTEGLNQAKQLRQQAIEYDVQIIWTYSIKTAKDAEAAANTAKPPSLAGYVLPIAVVSAGGATTTTAFLLRRKRKKETQKPQQ